MACGCARCSSFVLHAPAALPRSKHDMFACYSFVCAGRASFGVSEQALILFIQHRSTAVSDKYSSALLWSSPINTRNL